MAGLYRQIGVNKWEYAYAANIFPTCVYMCRATFADKLRVYCLVLDRSGRVVKAVTAFDHSTDAKLPTFESVAQRVQDDILRVTPLLKYVHASLYVGSVVLPHLLPAPPDNKRYQTGCGSADGEKFYRVAQATRFSGAQH